MYLYLGQNQVLPKAEVLGVFDLDNASWSYRTREFLAKAEKRGRVTDVSGALPKSFVLTCPVSDWPDPARGRVYLAQPSPATLLKRWNDGGAASSETE